MISRHRTACAATCSDTRALTATGSADTRRAMDRSTTWFLATWLCSSIATAQTAPSHSPSPAPTDVSPSAAPSSSEPDAAVSSAHVAAVVPSEASGAPTDELRAPGAGRVPLVVESVRGQQSVGVTFEASSRTVARDDVCKTPCTLYVPPGAATLLTYGPGIAETETDVMIGRAGLRVHMRAPSETSLAMGRALSVTGLLAGIGGAVLLLTGISDVTSTHTGSPPLGLVIAGSVTMGVGAGLMIPGLLLLAGTHGGVATSGPVASRLDRVRFGLVPTPGGAFGQVSLLF